MGTRHRRKSQNVQTALGCPAHAAPVPFAGAHPSVATVGKLRPAVEYRLQRRSVAGRGSVENGVPVGADNDLRCLDSAGTAGGQRR